MPDLSGTLGVENMATKSASNVPPNGFKNHTDSNGKKFCPSCHGAIPLYGTCPCGKSEGKAVY